MPLFGYSLTHQATADGSRSTVISPLQWMMAILITGILGLIRLNAPQWLIIILAILAALTFVMYAWSYFYFSCKDPDALRSEKFSLSKLAIEKGLIGDSMSGTFKQISTKPGSLKIRPHIDTESTDDSAEETP